MLLSEKKVTLMRNDEIEKEILDNFVIKGKRKRIMWELRSEKKRNFAMWRFAHPHLLKPECIKPVKYSDPESIKEYLFKVKNYKEVYYFGYSFAGLVDVNQAAEMASEDLCCIIYCGEGFGYYRGEQYEGNGIGAAPPRFLLCANQK